MPPARWSTRLLPPRQTHEDCAGRENLQARPRASGLRHPPLHARSGSRPLPGGGPDAAGAKGDGVERASLPSPPPPLPTPPPTWGPALRKAWTPPATAPALGSAPAGGTAPGHAWAGTGGLGDEGVGAGRPGVRWSPEFPRGRTEGTRRLGLCTRSTDRASCSRAAADHAWPRQPIGRSLTHLCR